MGNPKRRGYRVERKIRKIFEECGWKTIRAGASLGKADIVCVRDGVCLLIQVKSTKKKKLYYYEHMKPYLEGFPFYLVVDFGYGKIRITKPRKGLEPHEGEDLNEFLDGKKYLVGARNQININLNKKKK